MLHGHPDSYYFVCCSCGQIIHSYVPELSQTCPTCSAYRFHGPMIRVAAKGKADDIKAESKPDPWDG